MLCLCAWVLVQMLGMPLTFFDLTTSSDLAAGSTCQEFSVLPSVPEPRVSCRSVASANVQTFPPLLVFVTSVFHPPQE